MSNSCSSKFVIKSLLLVEAVPERHRFLSQHQVGDKGSCMSIGHNEFAMQQPSSAQNVNAFVQAPKSKTVHVALHSPKDKYTSKMTVKHV